MLTCVVDGAVTVITRPPLARRSRSRLVKRNGPRWLVASISSNPSADFWYRDVKADAMFSSASMWPVVRFSSRAAARTEAIEDRSRAGRDSAMTCARRFCNAATVAEPIAPVAPRRKRCTPDKVVVTTPDYESILKIKEKFPEIRAGLTRRHVEQTDADFLCLDQQYVTNEALSFCEQNNIDAWVWTVDDMSLMRRLVASGRIQGLITNRPDRALKLRSARS